MRPPHGIRCRFHSKDDCIPCSVNSPQIGYGRGMQTLEALDSGKHKALDDIDDARRVSFTWLTLALLSGSVVCLAVAPFLLPDGYSWIAHTVSESGGQGVGWGWVVRIGVLMAACAGFLMVALAGRRWSLGARFFIRFYSAALIGVALVADGSWDDSRPYNHLEAFFHTFSAFWAAVGFALGVLLVSLRRTGVSPWVRSYDLLLVAATITIPILMLVFEPYAGMLQRTLALLGYGWLFMETWLVGSEVVSPVPSPSTA